MDGDVCESPKVDELMELLASFQRDVPGRKVLVFSEWVRMLELVIAGNR
ncbi:MAG: hypothetical protein IJJ33_02150 [Victivallales bacterium]|nr:hypothetical protein [Victivallales bacterium]